MRESLEKSNCDESRKRARDNERKERMRVCLRSRERLKKKNL